MIHIENLSIVVIIYWHTPTVMMMIIMLGQVLHNVHNKHNKTVNCVETPNLNINRVFMNAGCWWEMVPVLNPLIAAPTPPPTPPHPLGGSSPQPAGRTGCYSQVSTGSCVKLTPEWYWSYITDFKWCHVFSAAELYVVSDGRCEDEDIWYKAAAVSPSAPWSSWPQPVTHYPP